MYEIVYYKDKKGRSPVGLWQRELFDRREIALLNKLDRYLDLLRERGTHIGMPFVRNMQVPKLPDKIWELRVSKHRVFFFCFCGNKIVLLHPFVKESQKTPTREIDKAVREYRDWIESGGRY